MKTGILYFTTCFHGFAILRHVDPFVRMLHNYAFPYRCFKVTNIMLSIHSTGTTPLGKTKDFSIRIIKCNTNLSKC